VRVLYVLLLLSMFLTACTPKKVEKVRIPPTLRADNIPKPFSGKIEVGTFAVPFKYYPQRDKVVFPLLYAGFVYYRNKTLGVGDKKVSLPLELWRILKHRLVFPNYSLQRTERGYLITSRRGDTYIELSTDRFFRPLEAEICDVSKCIEVLYRAQSVKLTVYGVDIYFLLKGEGAKISERGT